MFPLTESPYVQCFMIIVIIRRMAEKKLLMVTFDGNIKEMIAEVGQDGMTSRGLQVLFAGRCEKI